MCTQQSPAKVHGGATAAAQRSLAQYCRRDDAPAVPGADAVRMEEYRRMARNVIADGLESAYPLTVSALAPEDWDGLVYRFFAEHDCGSAQVWRMPLEFMTFVEATGGGLLARYPFLPELLAFEWTEVELYMMEDLPVARVRPVRDWVEDPLVFHPEYRLLLFSYPVHLRQPEALLLTDPAQYAVLAFRDYETGEVQFLDLSLLYAWLLEGLITSGLSLSALLQSPAASVAPAAVLLEQAPALLQHLSELRFVRGAQH